MSDEMSKRSLGFNEVFQEATIAALDGATPREAVDVGDVLITGTVAIHIKLGISKLAFLDRVNARWDELRLEEMELEARRANGGRQ